MKLTYFQGDPPNFGDELNATMWSHLLPEGFLDEDESELFLGIGSILWGSLPKAPLKVVAGSGWAYDEPPDVHDGRWDVLWVRGPRTAARLGIDPSLAVTDAAALLRRVPLPPAAPGVGIAFMPHVDSVRRGDWEAVCRLAGVTYLDPTAPVERLLGLIRGARVVVTEAMHGAIVSDVLRTPWIAITPIHPAHRDKWHDWSDSLGIGLRPHRLAASNAREAYTRATGLAGQGRPSHLALAGPHMAPVNLALRHRAARSLLRLAERSEPQLSDEGVLEAAVSRCEEALKGFLRRRGARQVA